MLRSPNFPIEIGCNWQSLNLVVSKLKIKALEIAIKRLLSVVNSKSFPAAPENYFIISQLTRHQALKGAERRL